MKITVALPLYRSQHTAFIALESLCNQVEAPEWELLIFEELEDRFGPDEIKKFGQRLINANCQKIYYAPLEKWMPLGDKWILMAQEAKTELFLLQAGDCYSYPHRLKDTYDNFLKTNFDWFQFRSHRILDLNTMDLFEFHNDTSNVGADMCVRTELIKNIKKKGRWKIVDSWLFLESKPKKVVTLDNLDSKEYSINVHGLNNISDRKFDMAGYLKTDDPLNMPNYIVKKLNGLKELLKDHKFLRPSKEKFI